MKERITAAELKAMTMKELAAWVEFNACAINRTMVMSWGHEELFKEYHIRPEYIGYKAGRLIVKAFHFTSRTRKADAQSFAEWLHWAIFGEYPAEEITETAEQVEETETETAAPSAPSANEETAAEVQTTETTDTEEEEEEQTMEKPNFIIKCIQFHHDENFKMIGDPIYREFAGSTLKEAKAAWKAARDNNDVVKFSPLTIYDIINSEEDTPDPDGYRPGCAVDIVARAIVG